MKLKILQIAERGVANRERLHLSVISPTSLSNYLVITSAKINSSQVLSLSRPAYWFVGGVVRPGDNVILYSGPGTNSTNNRADGGTNYFFYWGMNKTIW